MTTYLDNASTTALDPFLLRRMPELFQEYPANPSSLHSMGRKSKKALEKARKIYAESINAEAEEIIFTSGATESINIIFKILDFDFIITSPSEHAAVIESAKASKKEIYWLDLNEEGFINLEELENVLERNSNKKILISIMHVNNEIGTIQDLESIGILAKKYNAFFHSDCVQSYGKLEIDVKKFNLDSISTSAHKFHGPKGLGFLYLVGDSKRNEESFLYGGSQEFNIRSGTQNLIPILAFSELIQNNKRKEFYEELKNLENYFLSSLKEIKNLNFVKNGPEDLKNKIPGILNLSFLGLPFSSEQMLLQLDLAGICISTGSACSSNKGLSGIESSYVLRACKIKPEISSKAIRISISRLNTKEDLNKAIQALTTLCKAPVKL